MKKRPDLTPLFLAPIIAGLFGAPCAAAADMAPGTGEIQLSGVIRTIPTSRKTFILTTSFVLVPGGKVSPIAPAKDKQILIDAAIVHLKGFPAFRVSPLEITAGQPVVVVGKDGALGAGLAAREVSVALSSPPPVPVVAAPDPAPEMVLQIGHSSYIFAVAISPDGKVMATAGFDQTVKLWDLATGGLRRTLTGTRGYIQTLAYTPDGKEILSAGSEGKVRVWNTSTGAVIRIIPKFNLDVVMGIDVSPDGKTVATVGLSHDVRLWDLATGDLKLTLSGHKNNIFRVRFSHDGTLLLSSGYDFSSRPIPDEVRIWNAQTGELLRTLTGHAAGIRALAISPDDKTVATGSLDNTVRLWDTQTGALKKTLGGISVEPVCLAFSPDGKTLAGGTNVANVGNVGLSSAIVVWDAATGALEKTIAAADDYVDDLAFIDNSTVAAVSNDRSIKIWDLGTARVKTQMLPGVDSQVWSIAVSPDNALIASAGRSNQIRIWSACTGSLLRILAGHDKSVSSVKFGADDRTLVSGSGDGSVIVWDVYAGKPEKKFDSQLGPLHAVALSPDNTVVVGCGGDTKEGHIEVWDLKTNALKKTLTGLTARANSLEFTPDGKTLITTTGRFDTAGSLAAWDSQTWQPLFNIPRLHIESCLAISPDGKRFAAAGMDWGVVIYNSQTGAADMKVSMDQEARGLAFSPDAKYLAISQQDGTVRLWNMNTESSAGAFAVSTEGPSSLAFIQGGSRLVTGAPDGLVGIFDVASKQPLVSLRGLPSDDVEFPAWLTTTPDGYYSASPAAEPYIGWLAGNTLSPAKMFEPVYKRPDLVEKAMLPAGP